MNLDLEYEFPETLTKGVIQSRPNRFIMTVNIDGSTEKCHCPTTGRIGTIEFDGIPCLLSRSAPSGRKTRFTVEAISTDPVGMKGKSWIGINQTKANDYIDFFLRSGKMYQMIKEVTTIDREVPLGESRIDFLVNSRTYVEVKMPLIDIPCGGGPNCRAKHAKFSSFDRLIKHFEDVSSSIRTGSRAIILLCYLYDAKPFKVPEPDGKNTAILKSAHSASRRGLEHWQVNLCIDETGVSLIRLFKLNLFE